MAGLLLSVTSIIALINLSIQQGVTCYGWTGQEYPNNTICPGSEICCNTVDLCNPNRFCIANNETIVPACANFPWSDCANICQYDPGTGFLPRAVQCDDGSYCCDDNPQCCADNEGIVLNGLGAIVSTDGGLAALATSTRSSTTSSSTVSASSTSTSSTSSTSSTPLASVPTATVSGAGTTATKSSSLSNGTIAAIVVCAVAVVIILGVFMFWVGRRRGRRAEARAHVQKQPDTFQQQSHDESSRHFLLGMPMYQDRVRKEPISHVDPTKPYEAPQELSAATPGMN